MFIGLWPSSSTFKTLDLSDPPSVSYLCLTTARKGLLLLKTHVITLDQPRQSGIISPSEDL